MDGTDTNQIQLIDSTGNNIIVIQATSKIISSISRDQLYISWNRNKSVSY